MQDLLTDTSVEFVHYVLGMPLRMSSSALKSNAWGQAGQVASASPAASTAKQSTNACHLGQICPINLAVRQQVAATLEKAKASFSSIVQPEPQVDWNDWMVKRELSHLYQTALDSVMAEPGECRPPLPPVR